MKEVNHTFAVLAYGESPYLRECLASLKRQTVKSRILVCTATPNDLIRDLCAEYDLPLRVNEGPKGIANDWNFACSQVSTPYFTLAHQDDLYKETYAEKILQAFEKAKTPLIACTDYDEMRNGRLSESGLPKIKHWMLLPLRVGALRGTRPGKRSVLAFGNAICCPSVSFVTERFPEGLFDDQFRSNMDWMAWEKLSKEKGSFEYVPETLMTHRIHEASTTSGLLEENRRSREDLTMFLRFWPAPIARLLTRVYKKSEDYNHISENKE